MENVRIGRVDCACISATTSDESIPPERNAPRGTSATMRSDTERWSNASSCAIASSSLPPKGDAVAFRSALRGSQYELRFTSPCASTRTIPPGST